MLFILVPSFISGSLVPVIIKSLTVLSLTDKVPIGEFLKSNFVNFLYFIQAIAIESPKALQM